MTVAEMINKEREMPLYESQKPTDGCMIDTGPVNTMTLAMTRAGMGQTVIEPTIDMWERAQNSLNTAVNDPKSELLEIIGKTSGLTKLEVKS